MTNTNKNIKKLDNVGYYNGEIADLDNLKIPVLDRANYFGDGVYDAAVGCDNSIFALDEHLQRFYNSAKAIQIEPPFSEKWLIKTFKELLDLFCGGSFLLYWQISRSTALRDHCFPEKINPNLLIMISAHDITSPDKTLKLITCEDKRYEYCNIKTINLLPNVLAFQAALQAGADEAVFYRKDGIVTECSRSNISVIKDGELYTHPADCHILPGIARMHLIKAAKKINIPVHEEKFSKDFLSKADEIIVTNSPTFCAVASHLDGKPVGGKSKKIIKNLQDVLFNEYYSQIKK